ncbi:MAG TPA: hypothetical protein GX507_07300 [Clostridia bacterium]|nr:hypothetical protein [Clostridia bacterium]
MPGFFGQRIEFANDDDNPTKGATKNLILPAVIGEGQRDNPAKSTMKKGEVKVDLVASGPLGGGG